MRGKNENRQNLGFIRISKLRGNFLYEKNSLSLPQSFFKKIKKNNKYIEEFVQDIDFFKCLGFI